MTPEQIEHRREWAAALRSGEYKQTRGRLVQADESGLSFCCLGVACDVFRQAEPGAGVKIVPDPLLMPRGSAIVQGLARFGGTNLPGDVNEYFGLTRQERTALADCNDIGYKFTEIADLIEHKVYARPLV